MKFVRESTYLDYLKGIIVWRKIQLSALLKSAYVIGRYQEFPETRALLKQAEEAYDKEYQRIKNGGTSGDVYSLEKNTK